MPRTGGHSIEAFFKSLDTDVVIHPGKYHAPWWYYNKHYSKEWREYMSENSPKQPRYFRFSFVRNPWSAAVSVYQAHKHGTKVCRVRRFSDLEFKHAVHNIHRHPMLYSSILDAGWMLGPNGTNVMDFTGRFENLQEDFAKVADILSLSADPVLPHENKGIRTRHYTEYYDDKAVQIIGDLHSKTIERFGYEFGK